MRSKYHILMIIAAVTILFSGSADPSHSVVSGPDAPALDGFSSAATSQVEAAESGESKGGANTIGVVPDESNSSRGIHIGLPADLDLSAPTASFVIDYLPAGESDLYGTVCLETPAEVKTAFEYAASIWAATVHSTVAITIQSCWAESLGGFLGYSSGGLKKDFSGAPLTDTYYMISLANALNGADLNPLSYDMFISYNSQADYYFGLDANTPEDSYDFVTLALHEIAHGLNFSGVVFFNAETQEGAIASDSGSHGIYDTFMVDGDGVPLTSYPSPSLELGTALQSGDLWFQGPNAMAANGGNPVKMYAPSRWKPGSSYSHLDMDTFDGTINSLMVYSLSKESANHDTGPITRGLLQDLGWPDRLQPYPPSIVWASDDTFADRVRVSFTPSSCATFYKIYRQPTDDPSGMGVPIGEVPSSSFDDFSALPGITYYYWVAACNIAGCSELSDSDAGTRGIIPVPEIPTGVNASDGTYTGAVRISWDDSGATTSYQVYRDIDDSIAGAMLLADNIITNEYMDTPVTSFIYFYWVRACNSAGCSGYSKPDSGYIDPTGPSVPTGLEASDGTYKDRIVVNWHEASGAKRYMVYRHTADTTSGATLLIDDHTSTVYEDTSASPATDYYYWVRACDSAKCTGYSVSDLGYLFKTAPEKPSGVTASDGQYSEWIHLNWQAPAYTDYYRIFRNTTNSSSGAVEMESAYPINSYDDLFISSETVYYYFIKACNAEGCSPFSNPDSGYAGHQHGLFFPLLQR